MYDLESMLITLIAAIPLGVCMVLGMIFRAEEAGRSLGREEGLAEKNAHNAKAFREGWNKGYQKGFNTAALMAAESRLHVWIVGESVACPRCVDGWLFAGVFRTEAEAVAACHTADYFVAPAILGEVLPPEMQDWDGLYYPHDEAEDDDSHLTATDLPCCVCGSCCKTEG